MIIKFAIESNIYNLKIVRLQYSHQDREVDLNRTIWI